MVAVACELLAVHDRPLGRFSRTELLRLVIEQGVTGASASTIWRWLTPNDFVDLNALASRIAAFESRYRQIAQPFDWTFTRADLDALLARLTDREPLLRLAA